MAKSALGIDVFISSTGEMDSEREICIEVIEQLNQIRGKREGFHLSPLDWKTSVTSEFGNTPQNVINDQIGDDYDIFLGFICSRFGTPTSNYGSGTHEEFDLALQRHLKDSTSVGLSFFFKDPKSADLDLEARELLRIEDFQKSISDQGLYKTFQDHSEFRAQIVAALSRHVDRILDNTNSITRTKSSQDLPSQHPTGTALVIADEYDQDLGIMELTDATEQLLASITSRWSEMGSATQRLGEKVTLRVGELKAVPIMADGCKDRRKVKSVLDKIAAEMDRHSSILERENQSAKKETSDFFRLTQRTVLMSAEDGMATNEEVDLLQQTYQDMQFSVKQTTSEIESLKVAVAGVPRLTSRINQARRRSEKAIRGVIKSLSNFDAGISAVLESLESEVSKRLTY